MPAALGTIFNAASMTPPPPTSSPVPVGEAASCAQHVTTTNPHHHHHHHAEDDIPLNPPSQSQQQLCLRCAYPISYDRSVYDVIKCLPDMLLHVGYNVQRLVIESGRNDATSVSLTIQPTRKRARSSDVGVATAPQVSQPHSSPQERPMKRLAVPSVPAQAASSCRICVSSCCSTNSLCKARICGHRNEEVSPTSPSRPPPAVNRQDTLDRNTTQQPQHHNQTLSTHDHHDSHPPPLPHSRQIRPSKRTQSQQHQHSNRQNQQQDHHQAHSITPQQPQQQQPNTSTPNHPRATSDHPLGGVSTTAPLHNKTRSGHSHSHHRAHSCGRVTRTHQRIRQNVPAPSNPYTSTQPTQRRLHELLPLPDMAATRDHDENASPAATAAAAVEAATVALASQTALAAHAHPTRDSAGAWTATTAPVAATAAASAAVNAMGHHSGVYDAVGGRMTEGLAAELAGDTPTGNHPPSERRRRSTNINEAAVVQAAVAAVIENQSAPVTQTVDTTNQNDGTGGNDRGSGTATGATATIRPPPELLCPPCNIRFDIELDLRRHQFNDHKDDKTMSKAISKTSSGRFLCLMHSCPQSFVRRHVMERHFKTVHLKLKDFLCPSCDHAFADSSTRDAHRVAVHEKRKPWQCDTCSKTFTQSSSLGKHRRRFHSQTTATATAANAAATNVNVTDAAQQ